MNETREPLAEIAERINPLNDYVFKRVIGEQEDEKWLLAFVNAVLAKTGGGNIVSLNVDNDKEIPPEYIADKGNYLDVLAVTDKGDKINIEVQLINAGDMAKRSLFYWSRLYVKNFSKGKSYDVLQKAITINILNYEFIKELDAFHTSFHIREDEHKDYVLTGELEIHFLDMVKFRKQKADIDNPLHRWLLFLDKNTKPEALKEALEMDAIIAEAEAKLESLAKNEKDMGLYRMREKGLLDIISGMQSAKAEGIAEVAKSLKISGLLTIDQIADVSGLSKEDVEKL
ncbi:MAG: Rpn family recombination-promoting nuclease/putative transposase [Helicobacteraceae bacterium]|jgi:predicted transposase/invertase (TIGR01784 family)|nr:Rpn family recombination-promoting nuclease/putative transposase [Helicobacteraceae bacterium]